MWRPRGIGLSDPDFAGDTEIQSAVDELVERADGDLSNAFTAEKNRLDGARNGLDARVEALTQRVDRALSKDATAQARVGDHAAAYQRKKDDLADHEARIAGWKALGVGSESKKLMGAFYRVLLSILFFADLSIFVVAASVAFGTDPTDLGDAFNWVGIAIGFIVFMLGIYAGQRLKEVSLRRRKFRRARTPKEIAAQTEQGGLEAEASKLVVAEWEQLQRSSGLIDGLTWSISVIFCIFVAAAMYVRLNGLEIGDDPVILVLIGLVPVLVMLFEYMAFDAHERIVRRGPMHILTGLLARRASWIRQRAERRLASFTAAANNRKGQLLERGRLVLEARQNHWEAAQKAALRGVRALAGDAQERAIPNVAQRLK